MSAYTDVAYNAAVEKVLEAISEQLEELSERYPDEITEVNLEGGVLSIDTSRGKYVLNKQAPNRQLWLSSPLSGPFHYNIEQENNEKICTACSRNGHSLLKRLNDELSQILGETIRLDF